MPQKKGKPHRKSGVVESHEQWPYSKPSPSERSSWPWDEAEEAKPEVIEVDRFLTVPDIAERLGFTDQAIRKWGREGKLPLRKLFGNFGRLGMAESELTAIITGQGPGVDHGQSTA